MKYIILSVLLLGLVSCSVPNPLNNDSKEETASGILAEDTNTGAVIESDRENMENEDNSGSVSEEISETGALEGSGEIFDDKEDIHTETGTKKWEKDSKIEDSEIEKIKKDIDNIFLDIENGGK